MKPVHVAFGVLAVLGLVAWLIFHSGPRPAGSDPATRQPSPPPGAASRQPAGSPTSQAPVEAVREHLSRLTEVLGRMTGSEPVTIALSELRKDLLALPRDQAVALITQFLDSRADAATQLGFAVGPGGTLTESPSLRVFLLDLLATIDPAAAAAYAETILAAPTSPDEWAVAMRNLARGRNDEPGRALLGEKFVQLIHNQDWLSRPTAGFLEAFDVAVHLRNPALVSPLMALVNTNGPQGAAHAAHLALDRMIQQDPAPMIAALLRDPAGLPGHDLTRAGYVARADVADPRQRQLVEAYLLNTELGSEELMAFAEGFPNANFMMSHNLITVSDVPSRDLLIQRDRRALEVVTAWLADPRFAHRKPSLQIMRDRIATFVEQARNATPARP